jgi:hypothetical protein
MTDPHVGPVFASFDDVTIRITPGSWTAWDMAVLDAQVFGGRLGGTPGYFYRWIESGRRSMSKRGCFDSYARLAISAH